MPYKPINLSDYKIDDKLKAILEFAQKEYEGVIGVSSEDVIVEEITVNRRKKKISEKIFDFLFEPKYDHALNVFPRKKA